MTSVLLGSSSHFQSTPGFLPETWISGGLGSLHVSEVPENQAEPKPIGPLSTVEVNDDGFQYFEVSNLFSEQFTTPTGMKEEILLLSWLIVLLRTRENSQITYDWAYQQQNVVRHESASKLLMSNLVTGLQNRVRDVATAIAYHVSIAGQNFPQAGSSSTSLILSTDSLASPSNDTKDEGSIRLELRFEHEKLQIRVLRHSDSVLPFTVQQHIKTLVDTVRLCLASPEQSIEQCIRSTVSDLDAIWSWNHTVPPTYSFCMQDLVSERARLSPEKIAIQAWDGNLTYAQVDRYSAVIACALKESGVKLHDVLPVCFEKSRWTIVALLAVMKVGATFVLMDPTLPLARLQNMAEQVGAKRMVSSRKQHELSISILPSEYITVVEEATFTSIPDSALQVARRLTTVPPTALMYIIFTSGSTGTPKGVKLSHETYTSSAIPRAKAVGYTETSRVLDFASYAFDVSIDSMLLTLGNGGCLCIPSDEDRLNDINEVIRKMRINYAGLTPSLARILDPEVIASLSSLGLGGEAVSARDVIVWGQVTRIVIGYGPCECTIGCTINSSAATGRDYISIGEGNGAAMWIVHPDDHNILMPVGAVGELLVEGPIVGQGYLDDPDKTAAAFIENPSWLVAGHNGCVGRKGRMYKTGDLGKYDPDGSGGIVFVGRKDTQVKLRGQRVELGEIESQLSARLPPDVIVIAEVIAPQASGGQLTLVAFIASQSTKGQANADLTSVQLPQELREALSTADTEIAKVLPRYMVPTAYIPVNYIPILISSKTDRKRLRSFGVTVDLRQLDQDKTNTADRELSDLEQQLQRAWGQALKTKPEVIRLEDNFFALGGNSLTAMKLVSVCRIQGLEVTVANIFGHPRLLDMAQVVQVCDPQAKAEIPAFSMISSTTESARLEASDICGTTTGAIEDIYPCTPTQESLFTFSLKSVKPYIAQRVARIPLHIETNAWRKAWESVVSANPILRTRLAQLQEPGLQQVVLTENIPWRYSDKLNVYLEEDRRERMELGQSLARYAIVSDFESGVRYMVWTVHHVLYDGWSEPLILREVNNVLLGQPIQIQPQIKEFVRHVRDINETAMNDYWRRELNGAVGPQFPRLPSRDFLPTPDAMMGREVTFKPKAGSPFTLATLIRGAWALVASQFTGSDDVVFGETLTGRDISLPGVESIVGPLIATIPIRIRINRTSSVETYLQAVQQGMLARTQYQHMGMQNIRKVSQDAQHACETGTGLVIQPETENMASQLGFEHGDAVREALHFNPYPLMVAFGIRKGGFRFCANFDSSLIAVPQMERMLAQLEVTCERLTNGSSRQIGEISCIPEGELNEIWHPNQVAPLSVDESLGLLRAGVNIKQGSKYPPAVVSWVCDPKNPSLLSPIGCVGELLLESAFLTGTIIDSPCWLVSGSSSYNGRKGKLQATGDLVQLREDGSFMFVRRKENSLPVQGYTVDITELEAHFATYLPSYICATATVAQISSDNDDTSLEQQLVVIVEQKKFTDEENVELLSKVEEITYSATDAQDIQLSISQKAPISLIADLKKLDKFIQDSLPSYMIPFAYVVVDKRPTAVKALDSECLSQLVSQIPRRLFIQISESLRRAFANASAQTNLTKSEDVLRSSWATALRIDAEKIDVDDNFFRLGGDSVLGMKLVSNLRAQGHILTVAEIFQHMRLGDAAKVLRLDQVSEVKKAQPYRPYSTLGRIDVEAFLSDFIRPKLVDSNWTIRDVSSATGSQALDINNTVESPRTSVQYTMLYFDNGIDQEKLFQACNELVKSHDILRTVFVEHDSTFYQVILDSLETPLTVHNTAEDLNQYVTELCNRYIESDYHLGSSFLKLIYVEHSDGKGCFILGLSHSQYDGVSLPGLLRDLETLYTGGQLMDYEPFPSYMGRILDDGTQGKAIKYWRDLLNGSTLAVLEGTSAQPKDKSVFHTKLVDISQRPEEITMANLLSTSWALLLARRLKSPDVTFGSITSGRSIDSTYAENVMGPCYQFTPIRVSFQPQWTSIDALRFVQTQGAESAAYDFLGFEKISKQCTQWPSETQFFDTIVHHQDFEDFDTMPFGEGHCRVDILNPHGDAARPFKAVSFVKGRQTHVGVVGSERDTEMAKVVLDELAIIMQELSGSESEAALLDDQLF